MVLKVDFRALCAREWREQWQGIAVTVGINWLIKPFSMALLGWLFIARLFGRSCRRGQIEKLNRRVFSHYPRGLRPARRWCLLVQLPDGDPEFTSQVRSTTPSLGVALPRSCVMLGCLGSRLHGRRCPLRRPLHCRAAWVDCAQLWRRSLLAQGGEERPRAHPAGCAAISILALLASDGADVSASRERRIVRQTIHIALWRCPIVHSGYLKPARLRP